MESSLNSSSIEDTIARSKQIMAESVLLTQHAVVNPNVLIDSANLSMQKSNSEIQHSKLKENEPPTSVTIPKLVFAPQGTTQNPAMWDQSYQLLQMDLTNTKAFLEQYRLDLVVANQTKEKLANENKKLRHRIEQLKTSESGNQEVTQTLASTKAQFVELQKEYDNAFTKIRNELIDERAQKASLKSDVSHVQSENMALAEKLAIITSQYEDLRAKYKRQQNENTINKAMARTNSSRNTSKIVQRSKSRKRTRDKSTTRVKSVKRL